MSSVKDAETDPCQGLTRLAEGKTKIIFKDAINEDVVLIRTKDDITAGDGARRDRLEGKAVFATTTTCQVYRLLNDAGLDTHFLNKVDTVTFRARRCAMIPLEVVVRRIATGSYLKRFPEIAEGKRFRPPIIEFFEKNDELHDPQIAEADILARGILGPHELVAIQNEASRAFEVLERAWAIRDVVLVDYKVEFGRLRDERLVLADVIDNDSWRIWPGGSKQEMKDKQVYRNLTESTPHALATVLDNYRWVARKTESFVNTRVGRAVLFRHCPSNLRPSEEEQEMVHALFGELHRLGIECDNVQDEDVHAAVRRYNSDGRPLVGLVLGSWTPWLEETVPFPVIFVADLHGQVTAPDAARRAVWQAARVLAVQDPALYGILVRACRG